MFFWSVKDFFEETKHFLLKIWWNSANYSEYSYFYCNSSGNSITISSIDLANFNELILSYVAEIERDAFFLFELFRARCFQVRTRDPERF